MIVISAMLNIECREFLFACIEVALSVLRLDSYASEKRTMYIAENFQGVQFSQFLWKIA